MSLNKFQSEEDLIKSMIEDSNFVNNSKIVDNAKKIIDACRIAKSERTMLDAFLSEICAVFLEYIFQGGRNGLVFSHTKS